MLSKINSFKNAVITIVTSVLKTIKEFFLGTVNKPVEMAATEAPEESNEVLLLTHNPEFDGKPTVYINDRAYPAYNMAPQPIYPKLSEIFTKDLFMFYSDLTQIQIDSPYDYTNSHIQEVLDPENARDVDFWAAVQIRDTFFRFLYAPETAKHDLSLMKRLDIPEGMNWWEAVAIAYEDCGLESIKAARRGLTSDIPGLPGNVINVDFRNKK